MSRLLMPTPSSSLSPSHDPPNPNRAPAISACHSTASRPYNAITDVRRGSRTYHAHSGEGKLVVGKGPVRTGVTAILPRGKANNDAVFAGWLTLNGNGEMTGTTWIDDSGFLDGPVMITNTHSVGVVRDAVIAWQVKHAAKKPESWSLPVVAETWDGWLNDLNGFHVHAEDAFHALDGAHAGPVEEGNVGGGTGMICNEFKGGIGTASRVSTQAGAKRSACSCNATTDCATSSASRACRSAGKFRASRLRDEVAPSSSSLRPTHR